MLRLLPPNGFSLVEKPHLTYLSSFALE
jgi:hypothetical protein